MASSILPNDVLIDIAKNIDMYDLIKLCQINSMYNKLFSTNELWEAHYNSLFDRTYISEESIHNGDVTYYKCKCGDYPGWQSVHDILPTHMCKNKLHYTNLGVKVRKNRYKDYKLRTKNKFKTLLKNDRFYANKNAIHENIIRLSNYKSKLEHAINIYSKQYVITEKIDNILNSD